MRLTILLGLVTCATAFGPPVRADEPNRSASSAPLRLPDMQLHDPWIVAHAATRTYYLYTSNRPRVSGVEGVGTMVYTSRDLRDWSPAKVVFLVPPTAVSTQGGWAPEVHAYQGRYYLFVTLHDEARVFAEPPEVPYKTYARGTFAAAADSPDGPFTLLNEGAPVPPADFMTLDGTLHLDRTGRPWMVYAHEWLQRVDGTMEAVPLRPDDLSRAAGPPIHLFKASDAPWLNASLRPDTRPLNYCTDGPFLFRSRTDQLIMLWSSYENGVYVQTQARSTGGDLPGPWLQLPPLIKGDSGHGMLFRTFEGTLMMVLHRPFGRNARGKLYEMEDRGDHLAVLRQRTDLDGDPAPTH